MNPDPRFAKVAAQILLEDAARPDDASTMEVADTVTLVARAIRERPRRRARALRMAFGVAAAAALALTLGTAYLRPQRSRSITDSSTLTVSVVAQAVQGTVLVLRAGETSPLAGGHALNVGDRVLSLQDGRVSLSLTTGTRLSLDGGGELTLLDLGKTQLFALSSGVVDAHVAKLEKGRRFIVRTNDAEIEVHGTSFRVSNAPPSAACGGGTTTRVVVAEGVVSVRLGSSESTVMAGESWPRDCGTLVPSPKASAPPSPPHAPMAPSPSDLRAQNDAFTEIVKARRRGNSADARDAADRFLAKYPSGPLTEAAMAERMKILSVLDRAQAIRAAGEYLRHYPNGFAHADADAILAGGSNTP